VDWMHVAEKGKKTKTKLGAKNLQRYMSDFKDKVCKWVMWMKKLCRYTQ